MTKIVLPKLQTLQLPHGLSFEPAPSALAKWNAALAAADEGEADNTISIYDPIGFDPWTGAGVTSKRIAGALRAIGKKRDVVVNVNSPGGDMFEAIAIYNLLRDHAGQVTVRVVGLAASAASIIAMAGDRIEVALASFMMIHNVWVLAMGNRNDLRDAADQLETFDGALADVYAARTGRETKEIAKLMDKETWFSGTEAIDGGFADGLLPADLVSEKAIEQGSAAAMLRGVDTELAKHGIPRAQRRALINRIKESSGTPGAAAPQDRSTQDATPRATQDAGAGQVLQDMTDYLRSV